MKKITLIVLIASAFIACKTTNSNIDQVGLTKKMSAKDKVIAAKVKSLISKMTLDEKIAELTQDAPANKRLGIPLMKYSEGLHGLWEDDLVTVYPQAIACGSTWDPELVKTMASQTAREARSLNISHCYSPNLDVITGDPRYGRVEESYGEDPFLVSKMGVAFIQVCKVWAQSVSTKIMF